MSEPIHDNSFIEYLRTTIRYLASGFVVIIVLYLLDFYPHIIVDKDHLLWLLVILAAIFGLLIYSIHAAVLDDFFYRASLHQVLKKSDKSFIPANFSESHWKAKEVEKSPFLLAYSFRLKREGTTSPKLIAMQRRFDQNLTLLVFLYASSYPLIFLPIIKAITFLILSKANVVIDWVAILLVLVGVILAYTGFLFDKKITRWEMWFIKRYQTKSRQSGLGEILKSKGIQETEIDDVVQSIERLLSSVDDCDDVLYKENNHFEIDLKLKED